LNFSTRRGLKDDVGIWTEVGLPTLAPLIAVAKKPLQKAYHQAKPFIQNTLLGREPDQSLRLICLTLGVDSERSSTSFHIGPEKTSVKHSMSALFSHAAARSPARSIRVPVRSFLYRRFTGHLVVPMMHFCPSSGNFPADDGIEAAAHHGRAHVHMNDEAADGCEGGDDVAAMAR
jgi:hypothetical protein